MPHAPIADAGRREDMRHGLDGGTRKNPRQSYSLRIGGRRAAGGAAQRRPAGGRREDPQQGCDLRSGGAG